MATPRRILLASHSPTCTTGYGRVTRRLAHAFWKAGHTIAALGLSYRGGPHELPYRIFPWADRRPGESFAAACREFSPEVLLTIGDPWMFEFLPALPERRLATWVAYFPVDGRPLPQEWKPWIAAVDVPVTFCRFTQDLVAAATGKPPELIYHGVDTKRFRPMDKPTAKKLANVAGHFVVGTVARNQQRKNLPALLKAFARFAENKSDALLYLHTQVRAEWDLKEMSRSLGIENKTRVTADLGGGSGIPDEMLATVYNALDVFVLPTMAEGFGLPIMEAQACGVPALVTDFSACSELVPDPIQRLKVKDTLVMHRNFEQAIVDVDDITEKLEHFYQERAELEALGRRCHEFAQQFEWEIACGRFVDLIERTVGQSTASSRRPERSEGSPLSLPKGSRPPRQEEILRCAQDDGLKPSVAGGQPTASSRRPESSEEPALSLPKGSPLSLPKRSLVLRTKEILRCAQDDGLKPSVAGGQPTASSRRPESSEEPALSLPKGSPLSLPKGSRPPRQEEILRCAQDDGLKPSVAGGQPTASSRRPESSEEPVLSLPKGSPLSLPKRSRPPRQEEILRFAQDDGLKPAVVGAATARREIVPERDYAPAAQERDRVAARAHERAGRLVEAEEACRRMLVRNPDDASALHLLGVVRGKLGDGAEAFSLLQRAIGLSPDMPAMHNDLGVVHEDRGEFAEAAACYRRAVASSPGLHRVWVNLANALVQGGKAAEALQPCQEAIRLRPAFAPARNAHGVALAELGRVDEAKVEFEEAVRLRPEHAEAHCNLGLTLLRLGDFRRGWAEHEWRRKDVRRFPPRAGKPWDGQADLAGRSILLFSEGGLGNTIQFARFASGLARMGAKVTVECQPALVDLLRAMEAIEVTTPAGTGNGADYELHCPLMSVPAVLRRSCPDEPRPSGSGTTGSLTLAARSDEADPAGSGPETQAGTPVPPRTIAAVPAEVPYLHPDGGLVEHWAKVIRDAAGGQTPLRIGVCWRGDQQRVHMRGRSFDPAFLAPLANVPGVVLISLQNGEPAPDDPPMVTLPGLGPENMRLLDVAAVMKSLDLVVTCDTSIAHLAGALGAAVWVALKSSACWRWMLGREDSPWYPTMRLFRQERSGDWAGVFGRMAEVLVAKLTAGDEPLGSGASKTVIARSSLVGRDVGSALAVSQSEAPGTTDCETASGDDTARPAERHRAKTLGDAPFPGGPAGADCALRGDSSSIHHETVRSEPENFSSAAGALTGGKLPGDAKPPVRAPAALKVSTPSADPAQSSSLATGHSPPATSPFTYFDHAYVLNMDSDVERMAKASARLARAGIEFERFAGLTPPASMRPRDPRVRAAHYACGLSHKAILLHALERGQQRVLVFEDDVVLRDDAAEWLGRIVPQLQRIDWDVFYLGLHLEQAGASRGANLREVRRGFHSHAYGIARKAMARMAAHIDRVVADMAGTFDGFEDPSLVKVCAVPILAVQEPNLSYTFGTEVDRLGQYFALFDGDDFRRHCQEMAGWRSA